MDIVLATLASNVWKRSNEHISNTKQINFVCRVYVIWHAANIQPLITMIN